MKVHKKLHSISLISAALILVLIIVSSTASAATTNSSVVSTDYQYEDWGQYPVIDIFGEKYVTLLEENNQIWQSHVDILAKLVIDDEISHNLMTGENLDLGQGYSLQVMQVDVDGQKVWLELDKDGEYVDDQIISTDSGDDTWNCTFNNIQSVNNITVFKVHVNQVFQGATDSIAQIDGIWLIDYSNAIKLQIGDQFGDYTLKTIINGTNSSNLGSLVFESVYDSVIYAYITNAGDNTVSVIDTATDNVTATVDVGENPYGVAVSPDGKKVYVTNYVSNNISIIDTATNNVTNLDAGLGENPYGVAVSPGGKKVYVTNRGSNNVSIIDTATKNVTGTVNVGDRPEGIAVTPDGTKVYVANYGSNNISIIDTTTYIVTDTKDVENHLHPQGVVVTPDGSKAYVTVGEGTFGGMVYVINTATNDTAFICGTGENPIGIAVCPDGSKVYISSDLDDLEGLIGFLGVIDTSTNKHTYTYIGDRPEGIAVTPDGTKVYVAIKGNTVSVIDTATNNITKSVNVGNGPVAFGKFIGSVPVLKPVLPVSNFNSNVTQGYVPLTVQFTDLSTNATVWNWDFGDGNNSTDKNTTHTYFTAGNYTVNLTVSNTNGTDSKLATITILEQTVPPIAAFSASPIFGVKPLNVSFKDKSTGSPASWSWDFGDGNNSTVQNPVHIYEKAGRFTVSLTVKNAIGEDTRTRYNYILVV